MMYISMKLSTIQHVIRYKILLHVHFFIHEDSVLINHCICICRPHKLGSQSLHNYRHLKILNERIRLLAYFFSFFNAADRGNAGHYTLPRESITKDKSHQL